MKRLRNAPSRISCERSAPARLLIEPLVRAALTEDLAHGGDLTTDAIVPRELRTTAQIRARAGGVVAGLDAALLTFDLLEPGAVTTRTRIHDGELVAPGGVVADLEGPARVLLTGERTMLNLLSRLCGIATATRALVDAVAATRARIVDTRKTTPGLRILEKYAVRCGGGSNHRFGLDDAVLIKDNHLALAGSIREAVARVRALAGHMVKVEVEVDTLEQLREALREPIDAVLLDNMEPPALTEAVRVVNGAVLTEASGGIRPETIAAVAASGVDLISVGWLTHGAPALDLGLDIALG
ncbi:MAG TPA: carboxylating nicotinate-nucleotide diphosphorylase [Candidatus Baltobacteraceae bacterium]|nr:carboxylating nicotinate-nucleotide diphosphorylase [Candidatus Baltobacteraceae bacterium]